MQTETDWEQTLLHPKKKLALPLQQVMYSRGSIYYKPVISSLDCNSLITFSRLSIGGLQAGLPIHAHQLFSVITAWLDDKLPQYLASSLICGQGQDVRVSLLSLKVIANHLIARKLPSRACLAWLPWPALAPRCTGWSSWRRRWWWSSSKWWCCQRVKGKWT